MAKRKSKGNRSESIRDYLRENPDAMPKDVADALERGGVKVSPQAVSQVKFQLKSAGKAPSRKKKRKVKTARRTTKTSRANGEMVEALYDAKKLVQRLGSIEKAKEALTILEKLQ